jgi:predicted GNAT family N-acyltransferase
VQVRVVDQRRTRALRRAVLRPHLRLHDPLPGDELRGQAVHLAALEAGDLNTGDRVVGTCFVYPDPCPWLPWRPAWRLRQMATAAHRRGEGLGTAVLTAAVEHVRAAGAAVLWCDARSSATGFYARAGFAAHGGLFTDEQHPIPHLHMWLELRAAPTSSCP